RERVQRHIISTRDSTDDDDDGDDDYDDDDGGPDDDDYYNDDDEEGASDVAVDGGGGGGGGGGGEVKTSKISSSHQRTNKRLKSHSRDILNNNSDNSNKKININNKNVEIKINSNNNNNNNNNNDYVTIILRFSRARNFTKLRLHVNNQFTQNSRIFRKSRLRFRNRDTDPWQGDPIFETHPRDLISEGARWVSLNMCQRVGVIVEVSLWFDARWLMISEMQ
ncbi:hypothetical protein HELRODRAFT_184777, partial [Helobdella robusta]|uniref:Discoidin domain-containing protein n=1 Tax=Helobdella robusta TaxID=6412 RepID=T1FLZ0_HELRO